MTVARYATVVELRDALRTRKVSAVELADAACDLLEREGPGLNAVATLMRERAVRAVRVGYAEEDLGRATDEAKRALTRGIREFTRLAPRVRRAVLLDPPYGPMVNTIIGAEAGTMPPMVSRSACSSSVRPSANRCSSRSPRRTSARPATTDVALNASRAPYHDLSSAVMRASRRVMRRS